MTREATRPITDLTSSCEDTSRQLLPSSNFSSILVVSSCMISGIILGSWRFMLTRRTL